MNKKKLLYTIFLMVTIIITGTLAYFTIVTDRTALVLTLGEQDEVLVTLEPFEIKGTLMSTTNYTSFETNSVGDDYVQITIENFSAIPKKVMFYYRINSIDSALINTKLKYTVTYSYDINGTYTEFITGNFSTAAAGHDLTLGEVNMPANTTIFARVFTYLDGNTNTTSMAGAVIDAELRAEMEHIITPELDAGMIPVVNNSLGTMTVSADSEWWYDYEKHQWANAILVTEESRSKYLGTHEVEVEKEDILGYFVWIPRYEYRHNNLGTSYAGGTKASPGAIAINFIPSYVTIPTSSAYKIHPAFTFGDVEVNGFWMGKCANELDDEGNVSNTCNNMFNNDANNTLINGITNLSTQFKNSLKFNGGTLNNGQVTFTGSSYYGTTSNFDSHMAKNSEWGAVSYLGQSIYGACANANECYLGINPISTIYYDMLGGGEPSGDLERIELAVYSGIINDAFLLIDDGIEALEQIMSIEERTMSVFQRDSDYIYTGSLSGKYESLEHTVHNSGFYGYIGDVYYDTDGYIQLPPSKYYDRYTSTDLSSACNGELCYGHALSETSGWYNLPNTEFITSSLPWMSRTSLTQSGNTINLGALYLSIANDDGGSANINTTDQNEMKVSLSRTVIVKTVSGD